MQFQRIWHWHTSMVTLLTSAILLHDLTVAWLQSYYERLQLGAFQSCEGPTPSPYILDTMAAQVHDPSCRHLQRLTAACMQSYYERLQQEASQAGEDATPEPIVPASAPSVLAKTSARRPLGAAGKAGRAQHKPESARRGRATPSAKVRAPHALHVLVHSHS